MEPILIVSATIVVVALALLAAQARVPGGHVGMVLRGGRVVRVATAGQRVVALPLVDTVRLVPVSPATLEIPALSALTRDGVRVDVAVSVLWRVADPVALATGGDSPRDRVWEGVERAVHHAIGAQPLRDFLELGPQSAQLIRERAAALLHEGSNGDALFEVLDVNVTHITVDAGAELMRLLR
jgi:regulator of protease activity HflC (stomatin/prohibitin superfamily)